MKTRSDSYAFCNICYKEIKVHLDDPEKQEIAECFCTDCKSKVSLKIFRNIIKRVYS